MDQDRRDAQAWATEWQIKRKNRRWLVLGAVVLVIAALYFIINFLTVHMTRTTYGSVEEMRAALQGRFETDYAEDFEIIGDDVTLTYYERSHYDLDFAQRYGYSEYDDSVYEDTVEEWDYRHGVIKCRWMAEIKVDKDGDLEYYGQKFRKSNDPKPVPFDPSILDPEPATEEPAEPDELEEEQTEASEASKEQTDEAETEAIEEGVLPAYGNTEG
ncbi:MAG: hypothetical protein IJH90_09320 [Mogibacterium sp.]|nr:hypothetical protein [Mogibacterium sp.]